MIKNKYFSSPAYSKLIKHFLEQELANIIMSKNNSFNRKLYDIIDIYNEIYDLIESDYRRDVLSLLNGNGIIKMSLYERECYIPSTVCDEDRQSFLIDTKNIYTYIKNSDNNFFKKNYK